MAQLLKNIKTFLLPSKRIINSISKTLAAKIIKSIKSGDKFFSPSEKDFRYGSQKYSPNQILTSDLFKTSMGKFYPNILIKYLVYDSNGIGVTIDYVSAN